MEYLKFILYGLIQGLTEFIPVSSTAHLKVIPTVLGWGDPGVSTIATIQLGSILAVITYFKNDLKDIAKGISFAICHGQWKEPNARLAIAIFLGSFPILIAGAGIKMFWVNFDNSPIRSIPFISVISIVMALLLALAERIQIREKNLRNISGLDGIIIGLGQVLALVPGVSRSGITLTTALLNGWERQDAARFSFLLGIPAISFAGLVEIKNAISEPIYSGGIPLLVGISTAAIVSWLSIDWLLKYLQKHRTWVFVLYRVFFGFSLLIWWQGMSSN